jgi:hypothetical protein
VRTTCPVVRKRGPRTLMAQSWALVAPGCAVQVDVWSQKRSMQCFLQQHRASEHWLRRGREASTCTSKPSVVQTNVSHKGWSQASLAVVRLRVPKYLRDVFVHEVTPRAPTEPKTCVCLLLQDLVQSCLRKGGGRYGRTCAMRDDAPRPVWTRLPITH